jgi:predicted nucleic acid-binding protein
MGALTDLLGQRVYLDANVFIYALEALTPWKEAAQGVLQIVDAGGCYAVSSELTLAECLVKPLQLGQQENAVVFDQAIQSRPYFTVVPVSREILVEAARIRAAAGLKLPDAIHAATALQSACGMFVTNDKSLGRLPGLETVLLSEVGAA